MRGQAYKQVISNNGNTRIVSDAVLDNAANVFLPNLDIDQLPADQQANARNLTSAVLSFPQDDVQLQFTLDVREPRDPKLADWTALVVWPSKTDSRGEFDGWIPLPQVPPAGGNAWLPDGSQITTITALDVHTIGTNTGNSTAYLVPPDGIIVVSDIDDVLRVTKVYQPTEGLLNTFARNFVPWLNMPDIYAGWSSQHPDRPYHFHYLTTTPEQGTRVYMEFIYNNYPLGSFDTRPLNFTNLDLTFAVRKFLLDRIFQTFPRRQFVLVGDITNPDVMQDYPTMAKTYGNVACILIRNVTSTDSNNAFPYDTSEFEGLRAGSFMFFRTPDDIAGLDFANGACVNSSVPQQVTYGWQNLPLGITLRSAGGRVRGERLEWVWGVVVGGLVSWLML